MLLKTVLKSIRGEQVKIDFCELESKNKWPNEKGERTFCRNRNSELLNQLDECRESSKNKELELSRKLKETKSRIEEMAEEIDNLKVDLNLIL